MRAFLSFDVCFLPRRPEDITGEACLQIITACWEAACRANDFVPPLCHAHDNHFTQVQLTEIWLGIRDYKDASLPFLDSCVREPRLPIKHWPFTSLRWKGPHGSHIVFGHNDAGHIQKAVTRALKCRRRIVYIGNMRVNPGHLMLKHLPPYCYRGKDWQSDTEAAWCLNPDAADPSISAEYI